MLGLDFGICPGDCDASNEATPDALADTLTDTLTDAPPFDAGGLTDSPVNNDAGPIYEINCGGDQVGSFADDIPNCAYCVDPSPTTWYGVDAAIDLSMVDSAPMAVYQNYRYNAYQDAQGLGQQFSYLFPTLTPLQNYRVRLLFADIFDNEAGQRQFNVSINGAGVLTDFDIIQAAGAPMKAIDRDFIVAASEAGTIQIDFQSSNSADGVACINGIEIWASP